MPARLVGGHDLYAQIQPTLLDGVRSEWTGVTVQTFATRLCCEPANMTGLTVRESQSGPVTRETRAYTQKEASKGQPSPVIAATHSRPASSHTTFKPNAGAHDGQRLAHTPQRLPNWHGQVRLPVPSQRRISIVRWDPKS